ncbi:hypothetical protein MBLNU459_g0061t1 [Dothideomycetes sp. NU459]
MQCFLQGLEEALLAGTDLVMVRRDVVLQGMRVLIYMRIFKGTAARRYKTILQNTAALPENVLRTVEDLDSLFPMTTSPITNMTDLGGTHSTALSLRNYAHTRDMDRLCDPTTCPMTDTRLTTRVIQKSKMAIINHQGHLHLDRPHQDHVHLHLDRPHQDHVHLHLDHLRLAHLRLAADLLPAAVHLRAVGGANSGVLLEQEPLPSEHVNAQAPGYFHTYKTKHDLRLLYVDGQSAAKSDKGTLDVQDVVIINSNSSREHEPMFGEKQRADDMCKIAREEWSGRIDGILRMEGGFEIILCDFAAHLDVVEIAEFAPPESDGGRPMSFDYYRAVAARYDSIGGGRVALDYDHFVTVFSHADAIYFDETGRPRVQNGSVEVSHVRQEITDMVLHASNTSKSTDWQAVVDMIVTRYADRLEYLTSGAPRTIDQLKTELDRALRPFINYGSRNGSLEVERCAKQFLPTKADADTIAARAVADVSHTLCSSLAAAAADDKYETALSRIIDLKTYLSWTTWKRCKGCGMHEICFLPIWPVGSAEDFEQPKCRSNVSTGPGDNGRYWRR